MNTDDSLLILQRCRVLTVANSELFETPSKGEHVLSAKVSLTCTWAYKLQFRTEGWFVGLRVFVVRAHFHPYRALTFDPKWVSFSTTGTSVCFPNHP